MACEVIVEKKNLGKLTLSNQNLHIVFFMIFFFFFLVLKIDSHNHNLTIVKSAGYVFTLFFVSF
jgi:hypothetical protein